MRAFLFAAALAVAASPSWAGEPLCGALPEIRSILQSDYGERHYATSLQETHVAEFYVNLGTFSWSIIATANMQTGCVIQYGTLDDMPPSLIALLPGEEA